MRKLILALALLTLTLPALAGSIRPAAVVTTTDEDAALKSLIKRMNKRTCASVGLPATCTDAEAKAKNASLVIYPATAAGYQDYSGVIYASMVHEHAARELAQRAAEDVAAAYRVASPSVQAQVDALLGTAP